MIAPSSLSAFSASATQGAIGAGGSARAPQVAPVQQVRAQSAAPTPPPQRPLATQPAAPSPVLPRGSLLDLSV